MRRLLHSKQVRKDRKTTNNEIIYDFGRKIKYENMTESQKQRLERISANVKAIDAIAQEVKPEFSGDHVKYANDVVAQAKKRSADRAIIQQTAQDIVDYVKENFDETVANSMNKADFESAIGLLRKLIEIPNSENEKQAKTEKRRKKNLCKFIMKAFVAIFFMIIAYLFALNGRYIKIDGGTAVFDKWAREWIVPSVRPIR